MDVFECIKTRPAVRSFRPDPISPEIVKKILRAGQQAHSQRNRQPWHFITIENKEMLKQIGALASSGPYLAEAPLAVAVVMEGSRMPQLDGTRAVECMMLAAWGEGIGSCWVHQIDRPKVKELLGIPEAAELVTVIPFGYPIEEEKAKKKVRKRLSHIAHRERFGQPFV